MEAFTARINEAKETINDTEGKIMENKETEEKKRYTATGSQGEDWGNQQYHKENQY